MTSHVFLFFGRITYLECRFSKSLELEGVDGRTAPARHSNFDNLSEPQGALSISAPMAG